jgi:hypothetical protein
MDPKGSALPLLGDSKEEDHAAVKKVPWKTVKRPSKGRARNQTGKNVRKLPDRKKLADRNEDRNKSGNKDFSVKYPRQNLALEVSDAEDGVECMGLIYGCMHARSQVESCTCSECLPDQKDTCWLELQHESSPSSDTEEESFPSEEVEPLDCLYHLAELARLANVCAQAELASALAEGHGTHRVSALRHIAEMTAARQAVEDATWCEAAALAQAEREVVWRDTTFNDDERAFARRLLRRLMRSAEEAAAAKAVALRRVEELSWPRLPTP